MTRKSIGIEERKKDHLKIAISDISQTGNTGFERYRYIHNALPEIDFEDIDTSTSFLGKKVNLPFFISCMTGGVAEGQKLNRNLAIAAKNAGIGLGVGSQRAAIEHPKLRKMFQVRKYAGEIPIIANVGMVQLNYGFGLKEFQQIVDMIEADALAVHINPIQEVIQPEGDHNFKSLLPKLEKVVKKLSVPIIVKEVGFGLSEDVIKRLHNIGIKIFDTAGWGGTSWAVVEGRRRKGFDKLGQLFASWGISTTDSIITAQKFKIKKKDKKIVILGSGGVRSGIDIAKAISLGSDLAGIAQPFAIAALKSQIQVKKLIEELSYQLKVVMFGVGVLDIKGLKKTKLVEKDY